MDKTRFRRAKLLLAMAAAGLSGHAMARDFIFGEDTTLTVNGLATVSMPSGEPGYADKLYSYSELSANLSKTVYGSTYVGFKADYAIIVDQQNTLPQNEFRQAFAYVGSRQWGDLVAGKARGALSNLGFVVPSAIAGPGYGTNAPIFFHATHLPLAPVYPSTSPTVYDRWDKIAYYSPVSPGLQVGASWAPRSDKRYNDLFAGPPLKNSIELAAIYTDRIGRLGYGFSAGVATAEPDPGAIPATFGTAMAPYDDQRGVSLGSKFTYRGWTLGASVMRVENYLGYRDLDNASEAVGVTYKRGKWLVGVSYGRSRNTYSAGNRLGAVGAPVNDVSMVELGATYTVNEHLDISGGYVATNQNQRNPAPAISYRRDYAMVQAVLYWDRPAELSFIPTRTQWNPAGFKDMPWYLMVEGALPQSSDSERVYAFGDFQSAQPIKRDPSSQYAVKLGRAISDNRDIRVGYRATSASGEASVNQGQGTLQLYPWQIAPAAISNGTNQFFGYVIGTNAPTETSWYDSARARRSSDLDVVDVEYGRMGRAGRNNLHASIGVRYARLDDRITAQYTGRFSAFGVNMDQNLSTSSNSSFQGVGPRVALDFDMPLGGDTFSLSSNMALAYLVGKKQVTSSLQLTRSDAGGCNTIGFTGCNYTETRNEDRKTPGRVWAFEFAPGVSMALRRGKAEGKLTIGYRYELWRGMQDTRSENQQILAAFPAAGYQSYGRADGNIINRAPYIRFEARF